MSLTTGDSLIWAPPASSIMPSSQRAVTVQRLPAGTGRETRQNRVAAANNVGPWQRPPAAGLIPGLTAPMGIGLGGQPLPIFPPAGRHRKRYQGTKLSQVRSDSASLTMPASATTAKSK